MDICNISQPSLEILNDLAMILDIDVCELIVSNKDKKWPTNN